MTTEPPQRTPRLPPELRRAIPWTIVVGVLGLALFVVGFVVGVFWNGAAAIVAIGAALVAIAAVGAMIWIVRVRRA